MKICFIDDSLRQTCKMMEGVTAYYREETGNELECMMILVNIDGKYVQPDTIGYYESLLQKMEITLKECNSVQEVGNEIRAMKNEDILFMVDLCMIDKEEDKISADSNYKTISMQLMDTLEETNQNYKWYSGKSEEGFKDPWQHRFKTLYKRPVPKIYERNDLVPMCFKLHIAKEILGV